MNSPDLAIAGRRAAVLAVRGLMIAALAAMAAGCKTSARDTTGSIPSDYRERHPIAITEGKRNEIR